MNKRLAIKGHPTRGKEVMELLEMMGGKNSNGFICSSSNRFYYILNEYFCLDYIDSEEINEYVIFTLEEFLDKYPYKVGDVIKFPNNMAEEIAEMKWDEELGDIIYTSVSGSTRPCHVPKNTKNETNIKLNKCTHCVYAVNNNHCGLRGFRSNFNVNYCSAQNTGKLPNGFELQEDGYFSWVNKKPKYPMTYEECCEVLGCKANHFFTDFSYNGLDIEISSYEDKIDDLLQNFRKLRYCRDAYWKIAGEEMGLDGPWKPDYNDLNNITYYGLYNKLKYSIINPSQFVFPTEEMRDIFYENFKDFIKSCK